MLHVLPPGRGIAEAGAGGKGGERRGQGSGVTARSSSSGDRSGAQGDPGIHAVTAAKRGAVAVGVLDRRDCPRGHGMDPRVKPWDDDGEGVSKQPSGTDGPSTGDASGEWVRC